MSYVKGAPKGWPEAFVGKTIRYRWYLDAPWRYGLVQPYRDAEDSCGGTCIRVCEFTELGTLIRSQCLRFAYPETGWQPGAEVEIVYVPEGVAPWQ